jgi:hypothetical protein
MRPKRQQQSVFQQYRRNAARQRISQVQRSSFSSEFLPLNFVRRRVQGGDDGPKRGRGIDEHGASNPDGRTAGNRH